MMKKVVFYISIVEDDLELRSTLENFFSLRDDFEVLFSGGSLSRLLQSSLPHELDYLVLDEHLEDGSGSKMIGKLRKQYPGVRIIFITGDDRPQLLMSVLRAGAVSFIPKPFSIADIVNSLDGIIENGSFLKPAAITRLLHVIDESKAARGAGAHEKLTEKEEMVARHIVDGKTYKEVAECMHVSVHTVNYHTKNIYAKLDIKSRHQLRKKFSY